MQSTLTPTQQVAELLIGRSLQDYVLEKRRAIPRWPWALIAEQLGVDTGGQVKVSAQALRNWYRPLDGAA